MWNCRSMCPRKFRGGVRMRRLGSASLADQFVAIGFIVRYDVCEVRLFWTLPSSAEL